MTLGTRGASLILPLLFFVQSVRGRVSSQRSVDTAIVGTELNRNHHRELQEGDRCGLFQGECADGLSCVRGPVGGFGLCLPVDCMADAVRKSGLDFNNFTQTIFAQAQVTPEQLAISRANEARSDQTFSQDSSAMASIVDVLTNRMDHSPFYALQESMAACSSASLNVNNNTAKQATVSYYGFHMEGGALYDGEFSVLVAPSETEGSLTWVRPCFGGGGVGIDISAVIGTGYTGSREHLLGCSALVTDNELYAILGFGVDYGVGFNGVSYLDFTVGVGLSGEGLGIGLCGNYKQ
ncbi:expressed unknown protein [Seminavis robusta]|uniref:Uncharacterized protein n=1 Tax=Seminavis robusta TaxID=568900 RepID=A0A9N8DFR7_9STRA|nr:expressed unknown protein [Seminavis robusta]|eukprot:Sro122_g059310.1 n/a (294) ;mRNA; f:85561-86442